MKVPGRSVFGFLTAMLVDATEADRLVDALNTKEYPGNDWLPRMPEDVYTFSGEIPWSPEFARDSDDGQRWQLYRDEVRVSKGSPIEVETLAHRFGWESYHSTLNQAGGAFVPSRFFSRAFDLRGMPQSFDQMLPDGTKAAISLGPPAGFDGHLLYLRADLVQRYAAGRKLIWFIWGERNIHAYPYKQPDWFMKAREERAIIWRRVVRGEELSPALKVKRARTRRSTTRTRRSTR
jgi:hypothetical protein